MSDAVADDVGWADLGGAAVCVWGAGVEGRAAVAAVSRAGGVLSAVVVDEAVPGSELPLLDGAAGTDALYAADVVIKSPGISPYRADARGLRAAGVRRTGGSALLLGETAGTDTVGVTGSKGKSTTASLLAHLLSACGRDATLGGNIGVPPVSLLPPTPGTRVLELSSFQCAEVRHSPEVGVFTSFFPDHLDWHGDVATYARDKTNLFRHGCRAVVVGRDDEAARDALGTGPPLVLHGGGGEVHADDRQVRVGRRVLLPLGVSRLAGRHNVANLCAALTVLDVFGMPLDADTLTAAVASFRPLAHRLQRIAQAAGLDWYDDGLATTPEAAVAAIEVFPGRPLCLLLGGRDRGLDYAALAAYLTARRAPTVALLLPDNGPRIRAALDACGPPRGELVVQDCSGLAAAVDRAAALTAPGGAVLLSPAAPSFGQFADYRDRGRAFLEAVRALDGSPATHDGSGGSDGTVGGEG